MLPVKCVFVQRNAKLGSENGAWGKSKNKGPGFIPSTTGKQKERKEERNRGREEGKKKGKKEER